MIAFLAGCPCGWMTMTAWLAGCPCGWMTMTGWLAGWVCSCYCWSIRCIVRSRSSLAVLLCHCWRIGRLGGRLCYCCMPHLLRSGIRRRCGCHRLSMRGLRRVGRLLGWIFSLVYLSHVCTLRRSG
jgi:hypothetical protein